MLLNLTARGLLAITVTSLIAVTVGLVWLHHRGDRLLSVQNAAMLPAVRPGDAIIVRSSGQAVAVAPGLGRLLDILSKPLTLFLAVYLPAGWVIAAEVRRLGHVYTRPLYSARL